MFTFGSSVTISTLPVDNGFDADEEAVIAETQPVAAALPMQESGRKDFRR